LHTLLLRRLDRDIGDLPAAVGFEQPRRIRTIGFVATHVKPHIARGQQPHPMTLGLEYPRPMMRTAAGFHHHPQRRAVGQTSRKRRPRQSLALDDPALRIGEGQGL
jgi:hypothetical protein